MRPMSASTQRTAVELGQHLCTWRKLLGLTAQQVAERAGITRQTLARLEHGHATVGLDVFLNVARAVGQLDAVVTAADPYETDFGRARSESTLPQRVRH